MATPVNFALSTAMKIDRTIDFKEIQDKESSDP